MGDTTEVETEVQTEVSTEALLTSTESEVVTSETVATDDNVNDDSVTTENVDETGESNQNSPDVYADSEVQKPVDKRKLAGQRGCVQGGCTKSVAAGREVRTFLKDLFH